jgi:hypothetical protein
MPLSDHEQRLLDQIEQALYAEDPKFASAVRSARTRSHTRRSLGLASFGILVGLGMVLVGLIAAVIAVSVIGFVVVVAAAGWGVQVLRNRTASVPDAPAVGKTPRSAGLRTRMEDRLRRRFDES